MENTTLYTNKRLHDYLDHYQDYVTKTINESGITSHKYYHFNYSPDGVKKKNLKRLPSVILTGINPNSPGKDPTAPSQNGKYEQVKSWSLYNTTVNGITMEKNTPEGWLMQLSTEYSDAKSKELKKYSDKSYITITSGLSYLIASDISNIIPTQGQTTTISPYILNPSYYITLFSPLTNGNFVKKMITGTCSMSMNSFNESFSLDMSNISQKYINKPIGVEWFGYFKPPTLGYYTFAVQSNNGFCAMWFDDDALFDYTDKNANFPSTSKNDIQILITEPKYYPIRIQYFNVDGSVSNKGVPDFKLSILDENGKKMDTNSVFSTITNTVDGSAYYPPLLYCAFVSTSVNTFLIGEFQCYLCKTYSSNNNTSNTDALKFFKILETYKFDMVAGAFDKDLGTQNDVNYGTLPDDINYTVVYTPSSKFPSTFSIYRIDVDSRMGNTYQIDTRKNNPYPMSELDQKLLLRANNYDELYNYYTNPQEATQTDPETCKRMCNDNSKCNFYYTYTSGNIDQCYYDTESSIPTFSQIKPTGNTIRSNVDPGTSKLFMRNFELHPPPCQLSEQIEVQEVINTSVYNSQFPYANYDLSLIPITDLSLVGICGDSAYQKLTNNAREILFDNTLYNSNGSWKDNNGTWKNTGTYFEGFTNTPYPIKYTNALGDTTDLANTNLQNEEIYAKMQKQINANYNTLANKDIPQYLKTRDIMTNNNNYDYKGNVLLYYNTKPIPNARQQNINDTKDGYQMQNSLYILGTLTAATLLVFAIIIARE